MIRRDFTCAGCGTVLAEIRHRSELRIIAGQLIRGSHLYRRLWVRCGCGRETRIDVPDRVHEWRMDREMVAQSGMLG